jgi:hypothetical protein
MFWKAERRPGKTDPTGRARMSCKVYSSQTKNFEGRTKDWVGLFEVLFKGLSTLFGQLTTEKCVEETHPIFCSAFQNLRLGSIKLLQKIVATQKNQHTAPHRMLLLSFCNHIAKSLQKIVATQKNQHMAMLLQSFCNHLAKLLQKIIASHENQHIASHVSTIFCNHIAKLLQKIVATQKNQHMAMLLQSFCNHIASLCSPNEVLEVRTNILERVLEVISK